jgi:hypothetical protein
MDDEMNYPDFESVPLDAYEADAANVVPFKPRGEARAAVNPDLPVITIEAGELHNIATSAETALLTNSTPFYVRSGRLMRPVVDDMPASHGRRTKVARLEEVTGPVMVDHLSRSAI